MKKEKRGNLSKQSMQFVRRPPVCFISTSPVNKKKRGLCKQGEQGERKGKEKKERKREKTSLIF